MNHQCEACGYSEAIERFGAPPRRPPATRRSGCARRVTLDRVARRAHRRRNLAEPAASAQKVARPTTPKKDVAQVDVRRLANQRATAVQTTTITPMHMKTATPRPTPGRSSAYG